MKKTRFQSLVLMAIDATQPTTHKLYRKNNSNQCFFGSFDNENNDTPGFVTSCLCGRFIATIQAVNIMCIFEKHSGSSVSEPTIFNFLKSLKFSNFQFLRNSLATTSQASKWSTRNRFLIINNESFSNNSLFHIRINIF